MNIRKCILVKNDCYKQGKSIRPAGIVVHSTGANNPNLKRYVQPDDGILGVNTNKNDWNRGGISKCVHAFIGKDKHGIVKVYQTLPWTMRCWGCGSGNKGSYNNNYIQFEICEDALTDANYFNNAFAAAIELCAHLCKEYGIPVSKIVSHHEANEQGFASNHADCDHWLKRFGKDMDWFRAQVENSMGTPEKAIVSNLKKPIGASFKVRVKASSLNIRKGAGVLNKKVGTITNKGVYTIIETKGNWGKLKSGAGWINLKYTERI